jgi:hypothetical protein
MATRSLSPPGMLLSPGNLSHVTGQMERKQAQPFASKMLSVRGGHVQVRNPTFKECVELATDSLLQVANVIGIV